MLCSSFDRNCFLEKWNSPYRFISTQLLFPGLTLTVDGHEGGKVEMNNSMCNFMINVLDSSGHVQYIISKQSDCECCDCKLVRISLKILIFMKEIWIIGQQEEWEWNISWLLTVVVIDWMNQRYFLSFRLIRRKMRNYVCWLVALFLMHKKQHKIYNRNQLNRSII